MSNQNIDSEVDALFDDDVEEITTPNVDIKEEEIDDWKKKDSMLNAIDNQDEIKETPQTESTNNASKGNPLWNPLVMKGAIGWIAVLLVWIFWYVWYTMYSWWNDSTNISQSTTVDTVSDSNTNEEEVSWNDDTPLWEDNTENPNNDDNWNVWTNTNIEDPLADPLSVDSSDPLAWDNTNVNEAEVSNDPLEVEDPLSWNNISDTNSNPVIEEENSEPETSNSWNMGNTTSNSNNVVSEETLPFENVVERVNFDEWVHKDISSDIESNNVDSQWDTRYVKDWTIIVDNSQNKLPKLEEFSYSWIEKWKTYKVTDKLVFSLRGVTNSMTITPEVTLEEWWKTWTYIIRVNLAFNPESQISYEKWVLSETIEFPFDMVTKWEKKLYLLVNWTISDTIDFTIE